VSFTSGYAVLIRKFVESLLHNLLKVGIKLNARLRQIVVCELDRAIGCRLRPPLRHNAVETGVGFDHRLILKLRVVLTLLEMLVVDGTATSRCCTSCRLMARVR